ncbi:MAG TPA: S9 family peptidase [Dehalococcoidia bacterium]|nr:S9 family peptidase [Dehalococcoidia bacterium]
MANTMSYRVRGPLSIAAAIADPSPAQVTLSPRGDRLAFTLELDEAQPLYLLDAAGGWPLRLTPDAGRYGRPAFSPDGRRLAAVLDNALWTLNDGGLERTRVYAHPAGVSEPAWSPDGATIAFRSRERGWDQVWSVPFAGGTATRLSGTPADNGPPQWSPGARFLAYTSVREDLRASDIYTVDAASGREQNLTPDSGCWNTAPAWAPSGGRLAFFAERDGFFHLYVRSGDGEVRQLTFGEWEDGGLHARGPQHLAWSPDGTEIAFLRNREGKTDVMVVDAAGESLRRVSPGEGNWGIVGWLPDGKRLIATFDSPTQPPDIFVLAADGGAAEQITRSCGGIPTAELVTPERVPFRARDGRTICGFLYRPKLAAGERAPALVVPHGGPNSRFQFAWRPLFQLFAQEGYAVFGPDFRGSTGYGREFREANFGEWGHADLHDVFDAAEYLRSLDWIDAARIGIYGQSYGGYLVLCALTRAPELFACGVDLFGDSEIAESYRHGDRVGRLDLQRQMGDPADNTDRYRRGSPVYAAERIEAPLLILHGRDDRRVAPLMSERMIEALRIEGKFFEHHFYDGEGHGFRSPASKRDATERTLTFLKRYLKGEREE